VTTSSELLIEAYERVGQIVHRVVDGVDEATLTARVDPAAQRGTCSPQE
jgi:hypothetical protein